MERLIARGDSRRLLMLINGLCLRPSALSLPSRESYQGEDMYIIPLVRAEVSWPA